jgi:hypothetical protein
MVIVPAQELAFPALVGYAIESVMLWIAPPSLKPRPSMVNALLPTETGP